MLPKQDGQESQGEKKFERICPRCEKIIRHVFKGDRDRAIANKRTCHECGNLRRGRKGIESGRYGKKNSEETRRKISESKKGKNTGVDNPFYGKTHTEATKEKLRKANTGRKDSPEVNAKKVNRGEKNGRFGRSLLTCWKDKYGEEEANRRWEEWKVKNRKSCRYGPANSSYGKPPPKGSGNGWGGWYKDWYFRSLGELAYAVEVLDGRGLKWRSAETKVLTIPYVGSDGRKHTYRADFVVKEKSLIEIKPTPLQGTDVMKRKKAAAVLFCKDKGLRYCIYHMDPIPYENLFWLIKKGLVRLTKKYEVRFADICRKREWENPFRLDHAKNPHT